MSAPPRFLAEREAKRSLFGKYRNPYLDDPSVQGHDRGTANTAIGWHAGRMFALKEDSRPMEIGPNTLETLGYFNFDGNLGQKTFTAHPKTDPDTGELIAYSYSAEGVASNEVYTVTGNRSYYYAGETSAPEQPILIPKSADAPEGNGWIMTIVERRAENRSDIVILDSTDLRAPVCTIKIPFRLRYGFHGKSVPAAELGW